MSSALLNDEIQRRRVADELLSQNDEDETTVTEPLVTEDPQQDQIPEERLPETPEQQPQQDQVQVPSQTEVQPPKQEAPASDQTALQRYNDAGLENFEPAKKEEAQVTEPKAEPIDVSDLAQYQLNDEFAQRVEQWKQAVKDKLGLDINITEGYRDPARSDELKAQGIIAAPGGYSYHNYGQAIDYGFRNKDGSTDLYNEKAYTAAEKLAHQFGLTGISIESGHIQNADYPTINDLRYNKKVPQITGKPAQIQPKAAPTTLAEYNDRGLDNFDQGPQAQIDDQGNIIQATVSGDVQRAKPAGLQDSGFYQGEDQKDFVSGGVHTFGGPKDQQAYIDAKAAGATEAEALAVGDNGVGAPRLGGIDTSSAIGLAIPLDAVRNALGDKPTDWRKARVDVVGPNGERFRLPIVDFGPRDTAHTAADLTENAAKLFKTTDGKFSFKIVPNAGVDFEKDPDGFKQEQTLLSQGIDPGSKGVEHATFPTAAGQALTKDELAARDKALAEDDKKQRDVITNLPEYTSGSLPGIIKRLEAGPIEGVSDGMRQEFADNLKKSATAYAQKNYGITDPDEAYKRIMSDANVGTFAGEVFSKIIPNIQSTITAWNKGQAGIDENNLMRFVDIIAPGGTSPDRLMSFKNELAQMNPNDRSAFLYNMLKESGHATEFNGGPPIDMAKLSDSVNRLLDPTWQAQQKAGIAAQQAQNEKNLQVDPTLKGTAAEWWTGQLSQLPKMTLEGMTGAFGQSLMLSEMYESALDDAKRQHPDWTEQQQKAQATTSTLMQIGPAELINRMAGGKLAGVTGKIENPVQRILSSTLLHTGVGGGAMTLQTLGKNIAEGKPLDTDLVQSALSGMVLGAPTGLAGGIVRHPTEEVPRRTTEEAPKVEEPKVETKPVKPEDVLGPERTEEHPWYHPSPIVTRLTPAENWTPETLRAAVEAIPENLTPEEFQQAVQNLTPPATQRTAVWQPEEPSILVTREDANRRAFEISQNREDAQIEGNRYDDYLAAQRELASAKKPSATVTQGGVTQPPSTMANVPDYVRAQIDSDYSLAQKMGLVQRIEQESANRKTAAEIAQGIQIQGLDLADTRRLVRSVRSKLGIPSMDDAAEFENWIRNRNAPGVVGFTTEKGSNYVVNNDGTTTRNKAYRKEHGVAEQGPQPQSQTTFYLTPEDAQKLAEIQTRGGPKTIVAPLGDGRYGVKYVEGPSAGKFERRTVVTPKDGPAIGLHPVELWDDGVNVHFGNKITDLVKEPSHVTQGESEPWVSAIANRFTAQRTASGELGEIAPGQGVSTEALVARGLKMGPEEINQHVSDMMNNRRGDPVLQAAAIRAEEARLSQRSQDASRIAEANPNNKAAWAAKDDAFNDLMDFLNGPVAKLKNNWHAQGMAMQGEVPVDLSTFNGQREAYLKDVGKPPPPSMDELLQKSAKNIRDAVAAEKESMTKLGAKIDEYTKGKKLPSDEEVRNNIIDRMKVEPCSV